MMGLCLTGSGETVRRIDVEAKNAFLLVQSDSIFFV